MDNNLLPIYDKHNKVKNDIGKKVIVNSVSGAITSTKGIVTNGPYKFKQRYHEKTKTGATREYIVETQPYWEILLDGYNLKAHFVEKELKFI